MKNGAVKNSSEVLKKDSYRELKQLSQIQRDIYLNPFIVMLSGETDVEKINYAMDSGANRFMEKPPTFEEI
jgi:FixJ family two-component response regulator